MFLVRVATGDIDPQRLSACQQGCGHWPLCTDGGRVHRLAGATARSGAR
jgi:hypothetical protein